MTSLGVDAAATARPGAHLLTELGFDTRVAGDELHGRASRVTPEMHAPGTGRLRISVLATWADIVTGLLAARVMGPQVPVTLDLDVHLTGPAPADGPVDARARVLKAGRRVFVAAVDFSAAGHELAVGSGSFMVSPDRSLRLPDSLSTDSLNTDSLNTDSLNTDSLSAGTPGGDTAAGREPSLAVPLAERARCRRLAPGVARLPRSVDGLNSSNTVNGGLLALAAEEAALSLAGESPEFPVQPLASMALRYLRPVRVGPVPATATAAGAGPSRIELHDEGAGRRLAAIATTRTSTRFDQH